MGVQGVMFRRALFDARKGIAGWGLALGGLGLMMMVMFPQIEGMLEAFGPLLESPMIKSMVGDVAQFASLEGFLGIKLFSMMPLMLGVYVVLFALGMVAGEEEKGTLDVLLSTPTPRWRVIGEKFGALLVAVLVILLIFAVGLVAGLLTLPDATLTVGALLVAVLNMLPVTLFIAALTLLLSVVLRSRNTAGGVAAALLAASYFMTTLGDMVDGPLGKIKYLSFFQYYDGTNVLTTGVNWAGFVGLLIVAGLLVALSVYFFEQRDLVGG
ncbi:ABC transporter permease subunit [Chloroflexota bacterium]